MAAIVALVSQALKIIGALTTSYLLFKIYQFLYAFLHRSSLSRYHHGTQPWALVTGSSDGIGVGFAQELASHGFSIILHGRNFTKLDTVRIALLKDYPSIQVRIFVADARDALLEESNLVETISGINVTVLINNAGVGYSTHSAKEIDDLINTNIRFTVQLTNYLLPTLVANSPALILNMGSNAELGIPWLSVYAGTKAFLMSWGKALAVEMNAEGYDIEVRGIKVGEVNTRGSARAESFSVPSPRKLARMALGRVGGGPRVVSAYWVHDVQRVLVEMLPGWVREKLLIQAAEERRKGWGKTK